MRLRRIVAAAALCLGGTAFAHDAQPFAQQQRTLDGLLEPTVEAPAAGIDPAFWRAIVPKDNGLTPERIALGKKLYFDPRLSKDGTVAAM